MQRNWAILLLILSSLALSFFFFNIINLQSPFISSSISNQQLIIIQNTTHSNQPNFSLLIGILTRPDNYDRRHFLRLVYGIQSSPIATIDVKFIFCNLTKREQHIFIGLEILRFHDIIILNCTENMNRGKTYTYFSSLPHALHTKYDYVMKADDDVFIRLEPLAYSLLQLPRLDLYYGFVIPCSSKNPYAEYMSGMGFLVSWDIVEWIGVSEVPKTRLFGPEDKVFGEWLKMGNKARNRYTEKPGMYDYPGTNGRCSHELIKQTVAVHRLKRWDQWLHVLQFFNVTKQLKAANLHHYV